MALAQANEKMYVEFKYRTTVEISGTTRTMWPRGTLCDYHFGCWYLHYKASSPLHSGWLMGRVPRIMLATQVARAKTVRLTWVRPWEFGDFCFECQRQRRDKRKEGIYGPKRSYVLPGSDPHKRWVARKAEEPSEPG